MSAPFAFKKAVRTLARLRLGISGPSGSGKTYGALLIAKGLGGRIAVIDSEHDSASLYAGMPDMPEFDTLSIEAPYTPERFIQAIEAAEADGYDIVICDSITHEWKGSGGVLEIVDGLTQTKFKGNSYAAWGIATPRHQKFVDKMLSCRCHFIATMRSKTQYVEGERNGKKTYSKAGAAPEQRDGLEYEFTAVLDIVHEGNLALASKDRTGLFRDPQLITEKTGVALRAWLSSAAAQAPAPKPPAPEPEGDQGDGGKLSDEAIKAHQKELKECLTRLGLSAVWTAAKAACQAVGDGEAYLILKGDMEAAAERIKTAAEVMA